MRKRILALGCTLVLALCVLLVGCSSDKNTDLSQSEYLGTWSADTVVVIDEEVTVQEVLGGDFILILNADGTADLTMGEEHVLCNWNETSKGVKVKGDDVNIEFVSKDGGLEVDIIGVKFHLERQ